MRVISGIAKGKKLDTIKGSETRPTTDRLKETLFNIINLEIKNSNFLDLFSGSGAIGIEALSRGAKECHFVELSKECCKIINANLINTNLINKATVINCDCQTYIKSTNKKFDIIFIDAPYSLGVIPKLLQYIVSLKLLNDNGFIIVEQSSKDEIPETEGLEIFKIKKFKTTAFVLIKYK
jgi:16S rRNA (guanine966-N2)-methyltransferase